MTLKEIAGRLKQLKSAVIFCHMRPDGDTLGAGMGLCRMLHSVGVRCSVVCESAIPQKFTFLEGMDGIGKMPAASAEAYIAVDCSEPHRLGTLGDTFERAKKIKFNIDHHISNTRYADYNFVEERAATCEIMTELSQYFEGQPDALTANYLMLGLSSDTGNFAHKNVTESTFLAAAKLASCGADINLIQYNMFRRQSPERAKLFGRTMADIRYFSGGRIAFISVTRAQLAACYALAIRFAKVRGAIEEQQYRDLVAELLALPAKAARVLEDKERIQWFAAKFANAHDVFFVGRGIDYAVSLEGSLKMKEISYIHSEAYAAGELKHGTISLIEDGTLVIGVLTQSELFEKTVSNMVECKSRGAYLMGLTSYGNYALEDTANFTVYIPKTDEHFAASLAVIPLQLLGYYLSVARGLDVDKPRNLAKSVTVE